MMMQNKKGKDNENRFNTTKFHLNKEQTIKKTCEFIEEASKQGAELVCLGELHQSEYFCQSENVDFFDYANDYEKDVNFGQI